MAAQLPHWFWFPFFSIEAGFCFMTPAWFSHFPPARSPSCSFFSSSPKDSGRSELRTAHSLLAITAACYRFSMFGSRKFTIYLLYIQIWSRGNCLYGVCVWFLPSAQRGKCFASLAGGESKDVPDPRRTVNQVFHFGKATKICLQLQQPPPDRLQSIGCARVFVLPVRESAFGNLCCGRAANSKRTMTTTESLNFSSSVVIVIWQILCRNWMMIGWPGKWIISWSSSLLACFTSIIFMYP